MKQLRIVYMGTPEFAVAPLRRLVERGYNVVGVVTAPDRPAGRGLQMQQSAVKQYALQAGLPVLQPVKMKDEAFVEQFRALKADLAIVIAFRMLPEVIWAQPRLGTFNLHGSLLPQYRGAAPINWAIIDGQTRTGLTTFLLNAEIDKGAILARREVAITPDDTFGTLHDKLMALGPDLVEETIALIASGEAKPLEQQHMNERELQPAPKIFKEDCRVDWTQSRERIRDQVRGLSPYPTAWSELSSGQSVKIFAVEFAQGESSESGRIATDGKTHIRVSCADGWLEITDLQLAGKKRMSAPELLRGLRVDGLRFI